MNNKGFTLVELLATLVILAIITSIAVVSVTRVSLAIKTKQRENTIIRIENAASKYAFDTGETVVFVNTLIEDGYLDSDNDEGNIIDHLNNTILDCYAVRMQKSGDYYVATFINDNSYSNNSSCDSDKLYSDFAGIEINVLKNSVKVNTNTWLSGNLTLIAHSNSLTIDCTNQNNCNWTSTMGANETGNSINITNNNLEQIVTYHFTYKTIVDDNTKNYTANVDLKIDNIAPVITRISDSGSSTATISVTEQGSGVVAVCINDNSLLTTDCEWESVSGNNFTTTKRILKNGEYYAHVKDAVGNIGHSSGVHITVPCRGTGLEFVECTPNGFLTTLRYDLYRYVGTTDVNNYICFGTTDSSTCTSNKDKYMYRIIGVTESGNYEIMKYTIIGPVSAIAGSTWAASGIPEYINGVDYLGNPQYFPTGWTDLLETVNWKARLMPDNTGTGANSVDRVCSSYTASIYTGKVHIVSICDAFNSSIEVSTSYNADGGWIYSCRNTITGWEPSSTITRIYSDLRASQLKGGSAPSWFSGANCGAGSSSGTDNGNNSGVHPKIRLKSSVVIVSGSGTLNDPYILG